MRLRFITSLVVVLLPRQVFGALTEIRGDQSQYHGTGASLGRYARGVDTSLSSSIAARSLLANATGADITAAQKIVDDAIAKMTVLNAARMEHSIQNSYTLKPGTVIGKRDDDTPPPLLDITPEIARAAALLAEVEAANSTASTKPLRRRGNGWWMESINRTSTSTVPWGNDPNYQVRGAYAKVWSCWWSD